MTKPGRQRTIVDNYVGTLVTSKDATANEQTLSEKLVGSWSYVSSVRIRPDGTKINESNLKGIVIYANDGHFAFISVRDDLPKIAGNSPAHATADEALAVVGGSMAYFGTYSVNEAERVVTAKPEGSIFANLIGGGEQKRIITSITSDEMRFVNPGTPAGDRLEFVWKRAK